MGPPNEVWDAGLQPERTQLAWQRTGLALLACSLVISKLVSLENMVFGAVIAFTALVMAVLVVLSSRKRYQRANIALHHEIGFLPDGRINLTMVGLLVVMGVGALTFVALTW